MPASRTTTEGMIEALEAWRLQHRLKIADIGVLLQMFADIPGNSSYRTTTRNLLDIWKKGMASVSKR
jgi:hypothetical protein